MAQSAAAVIDLDAFRRRREARTGAAAASPAAAPAPVAVLPVWIMWVPVWFVA